MSSRAHSRHALEFTVARMYEHAWLYMWTFTLPIALDVRTARARWSDLQRELVRQFSFCGVRVFELHENHGLHVHVIASGKYPIRPLRQLSRVLGWGRIHVTKRLKSVDHALYVAKYLSKQIRPKCFEGVRVWAVLGAKFLRGGHTRVKDVQCDSLRSRACAYVKGRLGVKGIKMLQGASYVESAAIEAGDDLRGACAGVQIQLAGDWARFRFSRIARALRLRDDYLGSARESTAPAVVPVPNLVIYRTMVQPEFAL